LPDNLGRLRAGKRELSVEDEAGDAVDPRSSGLLVLGLHLFAKGVAAQECRHEISVQSAFGAGGGQDLRIANVLAAQEIGPEEGFHHRVLLAFHAGQADQAVRLDGVGRSLDGGKGELDAFLFESGMKILLPKGATEPLFIPLYKMFVY